jgi:hypothetical protein
MPRALSGASLGAVLALALAPAPAVADPVDGAFALKEAAEANQTVLAAQPASALALWSSPLSYFTRALDATGALGGEAAPPFEDDGASNCLCGRAGGLAANQGRGEYLAVGQRNDGRIRAQRLSVFGARIGAEPPITAAGAVPDTDPVVAYDTAADEYLVVWERGGDLIARRVGPEGDLRGVEVEVGRRGDQAIDATPDLAYAAATASYVLVWRSGRADRRQDVWFRTIDSTAERGTGPARLSNDVGARSASFYMRPAVAVDPASGVALGAWTDGEVVSVRRIGSDAGLIGAQQTVSGTLGPNWATGVAWNATAGQWLVVWQANDGTDEVPDGTLLVHAQSLTADLAEIGADDATVSPRGQSLDPAVAALPGTREFVVAWGGSEFGPGEYARRVSAPTGPPPTRPAPPAVVVPARPTTPLPTAPPVAAAGAEALTAWDAGVERRRLGTVLRRGLRVRVACSLACRARVRLLVGRTAARRLGTPRTLASRTILLARAGERTLTLRLPRASRRALRGVRRLAATVGIVLRSSDGVQRDLSETIVLRR